MAERIRDRSSPEASETDPDRDGRDPGGASLPDAGRPAHVREALKSDPGGKAETARVASGKPAEDATDATEAETPEPNLRRIGDPRSAASASSSAAVPDPAGEAIERATAALGSEDERDG